MRFSHYGRKRLKVQAHRKRITYMVMRAGHASVTLDEVTRVLAGDLLPPRRRLIEEFTRKAAVLCEAARQFARPGEPTTPEVCATYLDFLKRGRTLWSRFAGQHKERLIEMHRGSVEPSPEVARLYEWMGDDDLVSDEPILRAATLYWGLSIVHPYAFERPVLDAIVDHELHAGGIDPHGLLLLPDTDFGASALHLGRSVTSAADLLGDLTRYYQHFTFDLARALSEHHQKLERYQDDEDRLPWLMVRPPDELDRQVFDIIERLGSTRTRDILDGLTDPPPLRTLQRRLQRLCKDGLIIKNGARKYAYYRLAERF
ncbi:MAG: BlaI/MecI/CopY family transcriptional regulator [Deltaproteobacteria bacterium]|nr:BlaI/MecI/CopY family transcriptional regulator [Deltaproteobacteria bacterium]